MKRLILEIGSGIDLYGQDYTKAALRALADALHNSSIVMFDTLNLSETDMRVSITIGVQDPGKVDVDKITEAVPRGNAEVKVVFGGQNIDVRGVGQQSVVATCAVEAFVFDVSKHLEVG